MYSYSDALIKWKSLMLLTQPEASVCLLGTGQGKQLPREEQFQAVNISEKKAAVPILCVHDQLFINTQTQIGSFCLSS